MPYEFKMENELTHHGIKGQRWGVRRFQNKDGSLIRSRKRRKAEKAEEPKKTNTKKKLKDMSDDELREALNRKNMERQYLETNKRISELSPQKQSKGSSFIKSIGKDVIGPAAKNVGKQYLEKTLKNKLGIDAKDSLDGLKKEVEKLRLQKEFNDLKNPKVNPTKDQADFVKNWNVHKNYKKAVSEYEKEYGKQTVDDFTDDYAETGLSIVRKLVK